ncbi:hypothetical protein H8D29_03635 [PVC group bacterium]|nr:hypothetical protein [PVC group bacterium]
MEYNFPESFGDYLKRSLTHWIDEAVCPGHFVTAVLTNDLFEAIARADGENARILPDIVRWIYSNAPRGCWGGDEEMKTWKSFGGLKGIENAEATEVTGS